MKKANSSKAVLKRQRFAALITAVTITAGIFSGCNAESSYTEASETTVSEETTQNSTISSFAEKPDSTEGTTAENAEPVDDPEDIIATQFSLDSVISSVTADTTIGSLIDINTDFTLTSTRDMETDELKKLLSIKPEIDFEIEKTAPYSYKLTSDETLPENSMAVLRLSDEKGDTAYKWAFQTYGDFTVTERYPADGADSVSTESGIEITFSAPVTTENAEDFFEIYPEVKGKFRCHRNTLYFIPSEDFIPNTNYSVTMKQGYLSADGAPLTEDVKFSFKTSRNADGNYLYTQNDTETFIPGDSVCIEVYCSTALERSAQKYDVNIYKYDSADKYFNALKSFNEAEKPYEYKFSSDGMTNVYTESVSLSTTPNSYGPSFILLPDNLEKGYYLVDVKTTLNDTEYHIQRHIQLNNISVYSIDIAGDTEFFINDVTTGKAAANAKIELFCDDKTLTASTDTQGLASIDVKSDKYGTGLLKITYNGEIYCDLYSYNMDQAEYTEDLYFTYLYTDREAYLTTDSINVWGVVIPRKKGLTLPTDTYLRIEDYNSILSDDMPVTLDANGHFTKKIDIKNHVEIWWLSLKLYSGDKELTTKHITIQDYEKPTYVYDITAPVFADSPQSVPVKVALDVSFYDGTPVDDVDFTVRGYDLVDSETQKLVSDKNGHIETEILFNDEDTWFPQVLYFNFVPTGIQDEYSSTGDRILGVFRNIMLEHEFDRDNNSVTFKTHKVNTENLADKKDYYYYTNDELRGETADTTVTAKLIRTWYTKKEKSSYYDFLQKKTVKQYEYTHHEEVVDTYTVNTSNGTGTLSNLPLNEEDSYYSMELSWPDTLGRIVRDNISLKSYWYYYDGVERTRKYYTFECSKKDSTFKENEILTFSLYNTHEIEEVENGRILFQVFDREIISSTIYTDETFSHKMTADYIPNIGIVGAYFDGRHVYPVNMTDWYYWTGYSFDPSEREISFDIKADKDKYAPGDTATLTVTAKDINGKPLPDAIISLSVVDEAAFAVSDQYADPLNTIYCDISLEYPKVYHSYVQHTLDTFPGGEKGGGGDDYYVRKDFKDTAVFELKTADSSGKAVFSFKLPDNLTTWRTTVQAVSEMETDRVYAGAEKYPLVVTQPLFISPVVSSVYLEGDDICVSALCFGESDHTEPITVRLTGTNVDEEMTVPSGESANFGKMPVGNYKVLFKAKSGNNTDAIELPVTVTDTLVEADITKKFDLDKDININPTRWPMSITFFDKEYMEYTDILFNFTSLVYDRLDMKIPAYFAYKEFGWINDEEFKDRFAGITDAGLAKLMENSEDDEKLTALICLAAPEIVNKTAVIPKMYDIINSEHSVHDDVASAYLALAVLGEPVAHEIADYLERTKLEKDFLDIPDAETGFDHNDCLILCAALASSGDYDNALKYYSKFVHSAVIRSNSEGKKMMYVAKAHAETTATALLTASLLELPEADMMARYVLSLPAKYTTWSLHLMVYLKNYVPDIEGNAVFTYMRGGKKQTIELDRHFGTTIYFTKDQFEKADFTVTSGSVRAFTHYTGRTDEFDTQPELKVTKSITGDLKLGSLVTVTITVSGGNGYYKINDVIPSCARYVGDRNYVDNTLTLYAYSLTSTASVSYKMRIVSDGEYVIESAYADQYDGKWGQNQRNIIKVKGNEDNI